MIEAQTVKEAVEYLRKDLSQKDIELIAKGTKKDMNKYHHTLGQWVRNNMGLWRDNESLKLDCIRVMREQYPDMAEIFSNHWRTVLDDQNNDYDYVNEDCSSIHPDDASSLILNMLWEDLQTCRVMAGKKD